MYFNIHNRGKQHYTHCYKLVDVCIVFSWINFLEKYEGKIGNSCKREMSTVAWSNIKGCMVVAWEKVCDHMCESSKTFWA